MIVRFDDSSPDERDQASRQRIVLSRWLRLLLVIALAGAVVWILLATRHHQDNPDARKGPRGGPAVPVVVAAARHADVDVYLSGLGSVAASNNVLVRSRVDGQLMNLHFREGQIVAAGEVLAELDPRPFEVQVTQAEGQRARDQAQLAGAKVDLDRYRTLLAQDSITKQQYDTQVALVRQLVGTVEADKGVLDNARLQLSYSRITAPVSGRVGLRQVDVGNIIHASDTTGIVVITTLQPIYVMFAVPEDNVPRISRSLAAGETLVAEAWDRAMQQRIATGRLLTLDNQIDATTGTVRLKAEFPNESYALFPNQFVNARVLLDVDRNAIVVPTAAVLRGARGTYVWVVKPDQTVSARNVTTGPAQGEDTAITKGINVGERVVIDNTDKLREGSAVRLVRGDVATATTGDTHSR